MALSTVFPVRNLSAAKATYAALLGVAPHTDSPYYVGFNVGGHEIGLAPQGQGGPGGWTSAVTGPVLFVDVANLDELRAGLLAQGATDLSAPRNVAPGMRVCVLADADGNPFGLRGA
jgi:catechol 2,3-dioxygenase-like lactoylglutathione lyase family enzyme